MYRFSWLLGLVILASWTADASAQVRGWYRPGGVYGGVGPYGGYGWGYPTTPYAAAASGYADVIRSQGQANLDNSAAAINYEEARSRYIDNKLKWQQTYFEIKRIGQQQRDEYYAGQRRSRDAWLNSKQQTGAPARVPPSQLDPYTGKIFWPEALMNPEYADLRKRLEELFVLRAHTTTTATTAREIRELSRQMQDYLKADIRELLPNDYLEARKFLDSLSFEGQYAVGS